MSHSICFSPFFFFFFFLTAYSFRIDFYLGWSRSDATYHILIINHVLLHPSPTMSILETSNAVVCSQSLFSAKIIYDRFGDLRLLQLLRSISCPLFSISCNVLDTPFSSFVRAITSSAADLTWSLAFFIAIPLPATCRNSKSFAPSPNAMHLSIGTCRCFTWRKW